VGVPNDGEALLVMAVVVVVAAITCWLEEAVLEDGLVRGIDECIELRNVVSPSPKFLRCLGIGRVILALLVLVVFTGLQGAINACTAGGRFRFNDDNSNGLGWMMGTVAVGSWLEDAKPPFEYCRWSVVDCSNSIAREKISVDESDPP
jgi:hypothetical protein